MRNKIVVLLSLVFLFSPSFTMADASTPVNNASTSRDEMKSKIGEKNLSNIDKILLNLQEKQKTKTKEEYIKHLDALLGKLTKLNEKYSTNSKIVNIIEYLKAGIISMKAEYTSNDSENSFWEDMGTDATPKAATPLPAVRKETETKPPVIVTPDASDMVLNLSTTASQVKTGESVVVSWTYGDYYQCATRAMSPDGRVALWQIPGKSGSKSITVTGDVKIEAICSKKGTTGQDRVEKSLLVTVGATAVLNTDSRGCKQVSTFKRTVEYYTCWERGTGPTRHLSSWNNYQEWSNRGMNDLDGSKWPFMSCEDGCYKQAGYGWHNAWTLCWDDSVIESTDDKMSCE